jgi:hypothetical protein
MLNRPAAGVAMALCLGALAALSAGLGTPATGAEAERRVLTYGDAAGQVRTLSVNRPFEPESPFFQALGTNGRSCVSCHQPAQGMTITPSELRDRFVRTQGLDPVFRNNDGSNCEGADISTLGKRLRAFSLLLSKGLIRVGLPVPSDAEFEIVAVDDPYRCGAPSSQVSVYRRPLPATNLRFLSAVMWDGRETAPGQAMGVNLSNQALHATTGHEQGDPPSPEQLKQIVDFESGLFTAQTVDRRAGSLVAQGGSGGPFFLSRQPFCIGMNDPLGLLPAVPGACATPTDGFDPDVFELFGAWGGVDSPDRQAIARGEAVFNTRTFVVDGVRGLNGGPGDPVTGPVRKATCTLCHDTPSAGDHSVALALDIGVADASRRTLDLPLYTLQNTTTGETIRTSDPGRALITGRWADVGKLKGPILRGLAARPPYFHNGSAATLEDVVDFYEARFHLGLSAQERSDLVAFLRAL